MSLFRRKRHVSFRRPNRDTFRLDTGDGGEDRTLTDWLFGWVHQRRGVFSRYITAGGTRDTRGDGEETLRRRSWHRFTLVFVTVILIWILGMVV